jgi:hypothetical protein
LSEASPVTKLMNSNKIFAFAGKTRDLRVRRQDQGWDRQSAIGKIFAFFMIWVTFAIGKTRDSQSAITLG